MISALSFTPDTNPIKFPTITDGFSGGLRFVLWIRRTGSSTRQRIIELGNGAGTRLVLETGDQADSLTLGVERDSSGRTEIVALGALPQDRWIRVIAVVSPAGIAELQIFSTPAASGPIGLPISGEPLNVRIAGGLRGNRFVGQLSGFEIHKLSPEGSATLWGSYPLDEASFSSTDKTVSPPADYYLVRDTSGNGHDGTVKGAVPVEQYASPLNGPPVQVLELDGSGDPLRISPIAGGTGGLSLEAWIRPTDANQTAAVMLLDTGRVKLILVAGGSQQELSLQVAGGKGPFTLLTLPKALRANVWAHVAVTMAQEGALGETTRVALYLQGQQRASQSFQYSTVLQAMADAGGGSKVDVDKARMLWTLLRSRIIASCFIGGKTDSVGLFRGRVAEVRMWNRGLSAADIASRFLSRAAGNEAGLVACYRLERIADGYTFDVSTQRGVGSTPDGCSLVPASALPLYPTEGSSGVWLKLRGKLVTETLTYAATTTKVDDLTVTWPPTVRKVTVFDATIEPQAPDGGSLGGQTLQIGPDRDVTVLLDRGDCVQPTLWKGGQIQSIVLPPRGKLRLRFLATDLCCPGLRLRMDGMLDGVWTLLRPDQPALRKLKEATAEDLKKPGNGAASPLPAIQLPNVGGSISIGGISISNTGAALPQELLDKLADKNAAAYAAALSTFGSAIVPPQRLKAVSLDLGDRQRSFVSWAEDQYNSGKEFVQNTYDSTVEATMDGLKKAGDAAGSLSSALLDNGAVALSAATTAAKSAASLLASGSDFGDLLAAAAQATARYGQSQIATCIASADSLAVVATAAVGKMAHTFAVIGTSIVNGAKVVWRVICAGVMDALTAAVEWLKRVGAEIKKFIEYLAFLFNWGDFLEASDVACSLIEDEVFPQIGSQFDRLNQYRDQLSKLFTIPQGIGSKSLAQLIGLDIDPDNPVVEELSYVLEIAEKITDSQSFSLSIADEHLAPLAKSLNGIDLSRFSSMGDSFASSSAIDMLASPLSFVTTPIQSLLGSALTGDASTTLVDFLFDNLIGTAKTALGVAQKLLCARINIPNVTGWVEKTVLGGRDLTLLRLIGLVAAIPKVLGDKLSSGDKAPQSFAEGSPLGEWARWLKVGLSCVFAVLVSAIALYEKEVGEKAAKGSTAEKKAFYFGLACLELPLGLLNICEGIIELADGMNLDPALRALKSGYAMMHILEGGCLAAYAAGLIYDTRSAPDTGIITLANILKAFHLTSSLVTTCGTIICSALITATPGAFRSDTDKAVFGLKAGAHITHLATDLIKAAILVVGSKGGALAKSVPVLGCATFVLQLAAAITKTATSS